MWEFIAGLFIGGFVGFMAAALTVAAGRKSARPPDSG